VKTRVWLQVVAIAALALLFVGFAIAVGASHSMADTFALAALR